MGIFFDVVKKPTAQVETVFPAHIAFAQMDLSTEAVD